MKTCLRVKRFKLKTLIFFKYYFCFDFLVKNKNRIATREPLMPTYDIRLTIKRTLTVV